MNKSDLVLFVKEQAGLNGTQSEKVVSAVFEGIASALKKGEDASFVGFGSFVVVKRAARNGRNPRTGAPIKIKASHQVKFRPGKTLKEVLNK